MCAKFLLLFETAKVVAASPHKRFFCKTSPAQFENLSISCGREKRRFKNSTHLLEKRSQSKHNCICDGKTVFLEKHRNETFEKCMYVYIYIYIYIYILHVTQSLEDHVIS